MVLEVRRRAAEHVRRWSSRTTKSPSLPTSIDPRFASSKLKRAAARVIMRNASWRETASVLSPTRPDSVRREVAAYIVRNGLNGFIASFLSSPNM